MILHKGLVELGFEKNEFFGIKILELGELEKKMRLYIKTLQEYNAKFDLINTDDFDEIAVRHILDSLAALPLICEQIAQMQNSSLELADIGSGAGLPGVPLGCALEDYNFTLVERMSKRCGFLNVCKQLLNLDNVTIEENQAERLAQKRFDLCVFRAFRPLDKKMTKVLLRILKDNGKLCAYKAKKSKIEEEMNSLAIIPNYKVLPITVPYLTQNEKSGADRERNLVVITRSEATRLN